MHCCARAMSALVAGTLMVFPTSIATTPPPLYRNASASVGTRAQDLLARMTWDEKIGQMGGVRRLLEANVTLNRTSYDAIRDDLQTGILGFGSMLNQPRDVLPLANAVRREQINSTRLGIPYITVTDSVNGILLVNGTLFPATLGMASSWNVPLYEQAIAVIRDENHALGVHWVLSPELDLGLDPRNGRVGEMYGEDPFLAGTFGSSYVQTMQQRDEYGVKVATTIKHFLYGQSSGGVNTASIEAGINHIFNTVGAPFMKVINEAHPLSLMTSYASYDGVPMAANDYLLQDVLRNRMGFKGVVMSDALAIPWLYAHQHVVPSLLEAGIAALRAGLQLELSPSQPAVFPLLTSVVNDTAIASLIDKAVLAILELKFITGEFDRPLPDKQTLEATIRSPAHLDVCRAMSREAMVLLQNDGILPLAKTESRKVAVVGPFANIVNPGSYGAALTSNGTAGNTLRESLVAELGESNVDYVQGVDFIENGNSSGIDAAVAAAKSAGLAILAVGSLSTSTEDSLFQKRTDGEFFAHADLGFPGLQQQLVDAVLDSGVPTILMLSGGQAFALTNSTLRANAVIHSFLGGEFTGDSIVEIIFGQVSPSGKLPLSLPQATGAWPIAYNLKTGDYYGGTGSLISHPGTEWQLPYLFRDPPMAFGFGLTYTTFNVSTPIVTSTNRSATLTACLTNIGTRAGQEVLQLYYRKDFTRVVETANKQLVRFEKIRLEPGESVNVTFTVGLEELGHYVNMEYMTDPGLYHFWIGTSSRSQDLQVVNVTLTK